MTDHLKTLRYMVQTYCPESHDALAALDALEQAMREPCAWIDGSDLDLMRQQGRGCIAWGTQQSNAKTPLFAAPPAQQAAKMPIPPGLADPLDVMYAEGWNAACDAFFGGKPAPEPVVITVEHEVAQQAQPTEPTPASPEDMAVYKAIAEGYHKDKQAQAEAVQQEGWKLVPVEPTIEMIYAAQVEGHCGDDSEVIADYKAMLAAAPQPKEQSK